MYWQYQNVKFVQNSNNISLQHKRISQSWQHANCRNNFLKASKFYQQKLRQSSERVSRWIKVLHQKEHPPKASEWILFLWEMWLPACVHPRIPQTIGWGKRRDGNNLLERFMPMGFITRSDLHKVDEAWSLLSWLMIIFNLYLMVKLISTYFSSICYY